MSITGGEAAAQERNNSRLWRELVRDPVPIVNPHPTELPDETNA